MSTPRRRRVAILLALMFVAVVVLVVPPEKEFQMEGRWSLQVPPAGKMCPLVAPLAREWRFVLPDESIEGQMIVRDSLGAERCVRDCPIKHLLTVYVVEWKARAGYFSGYSEFTFEAELVRSGPDCRDRTVVRGDMWVDQGSRGDPVDAANAMGRWALEWYRGSYERLYGPQS